MCRFTYSRESMTRAKPKWFCLLAIEIESEYSNCFSRNLWRRNKRTTILFDKQLLNIFKQAMLMIHQQLFFESNWYFKFFFSFHIFFAILVFTKLFEYTFFIRTSKILLRLSVLIFLSNLRLRMFVFCSYMPYTPNYIISIHLVTQYKIRGRYDNICILYSTVFVTAGVY